MASDTYATRRQLRLAGLAAVAVLVWACSSNSPSPSPSPSPQATPTALPTPTPTAISSVLGATATPAATPQAIFSLPPGQPQPTFIGTTGKAAAAGGPVTVTIAAAGDIACDPSANKGQPQDCDQAATANLLGILHPTAVLTLGDNQYEDNTFAAYEEVFNPTWGKYKSIIFPTIGNHEYLTPGAAGYFEYFGFPPYYSYDLGNWHIISLDSECSYVGGCGANSPQVKWLLADLAAHPSLCTMVTWHEPRWSSGEHQDATQMNTIWKDLVAAKVDLVLSGHNHDYERFVPLDGAGNPDPNGTTEFVVGTGGKNHYGFVEAPLPGEVVRSDTSFGVIYMTLTSTGYSWRYVDAPTYHFSDSGSAACH
jgi:Calcineurin-like phosphoesterase